MQGKKEKATHKVAFSLFFLHICKICSKFAAKLSIYVRIRQTHPKRDYICGLHRNMRAQPFLGTGRIDISGQFIGGG